MAKVEPLIRLDQYICTLVNSANVLIHDNYELIVLPFVITNNECG